MAYVFMGLFLAGGGLFFIRYNLMAMSADFAAVLSNMAILFLFAVPVLTMRLFSEERRNKTDQLLLTSPVSVTSVVLGKYFAALTMFACTLVVMLMALAFFGKGFGALGWPVISDTAPKEIVGLCGGVFNVFGNVASIVTPLVIGYLVSELHSFNAALVFVGCSALMAMVCYLFVVGDIKRMELQK